MKNMSPLIAIGFFMSIVILLCALGCMFLPAADVWFPEGKKYIMGSVLLFYASFRFYRARTLWIRTKNNASHE
ncbi:MAG: hypothetical protein ACKVOK_08195 [Flavobacteriales bacterium]